MSPTDVARALVDADARQVLDEVLALTHPEAAEQFKQRQLAALDAVPWDELKNRAGPRAKRLRVAIEHVQDYVLKTAYGVQTLDELRALPASEVLRRRLAEAYRGSSPATRTHLTVVGSLPADAETEYAVVERRNLFDGRPVPVRPVQVEVMTVRKAGGEWRSMLDGGLQARQLSVLGAENAGFALPA